MSGPRPTHRRAGSLVAALVVAVAGLGAPSSTAQVPSDSTTTTKRDAPTTTRLETTTTTRNAEVTTTTREDDVTTTTGDEKPTTTTLDGKATTTTLDETPVAEGGGGVPAVTAKPSAPECKKNLVKNPSFESVTGNPPWYVRDPANSRVPSWTGTGPVQTNQATTGPVPSAGLPPAHHGSKYAVISGHALSSGFPTMVGRLSAPTVDGGTYAISAFATMPTLDYPAAGPARVEVRLQDSSTGAQSAPVLIVAITSPGGWLKIGAVATADDVYDRVVLRSPEEGNHALIDAFGVCRITGTTSGISKPLVGLGVVVLTGAVLGVLWIRRRGRSRMDNP